MTEGTTRLYSVKTEQLQQLFAQPAVTQLSDTKLLFNTLFLRLTLISKYKSEACYHVVVKTIHSIHILLKKLHSINLSIQRAV